MQQLHISNDIAAVEAAELDRPRPRKRVKREPSSIKLELEDDFLRPNTELDSRWLNELQQ
jgi:hypothetical protein